MRTLVVVAALFFLSGTTRADETPGWAHPTPSPGSLGMRNTGMWLTIGGGSAVVVGLGLDFVQAFLALFDDLGKKPGPPAALGETGLALALSGAGVVLVGIPLWMIGRHRMRAYVTGAGGALSLSF